MPASGQPSAPFSLFKLVMECHVYPLDFSEPAGEGPEGGGSPAQPWMVQWVVSSVRAMDAPAV